MNRLRLVDRRNDSATRNRLLDEHIQLLIAANRQLQMARRDSLDLQILGGVARQLENFGGQILHNGGGVDSGRVTDARLRVDTLLQHTMETTDGELETGTRRTRQRLLLLLADADLSTLAADAKAALSASARLAALATETDARRAEVVAQLSTAEERLAAKKGLAAAATTEERLAASATE